MSDAVFTVRPRRRHRRGARNAAAGSGLAGRAVTAIGLSCKRKCWLRLVLSFGSPSRRSPRCATWTGGAPVDPETFHGHNDARPFSKPVVGPHPWTGIRHRAAHASHREWPGVGVLGADPEHGSLSQAWRSNPAMWSRISPAPVRIRRSPRTSPDELTTPGGGRPPLPGWGRTADPHHRPNRRHAHGRGVRPGRRPARWTRCTWTAGRSSGHGSSPNS